MISTTATNPRARIVCANLQTIAFAAIDIAKKENRDIIQAVREDVTSSRYWPEFIDLFAANEIPEDWMNGKTIGRVIWLWAKNEVATLT